MSKLFEEPAEQQPTYAELREEFRARNLARIRSLFGQRHSRGWDQIIADIPRSFFTAEGWGIEMLRHLDKVVEQDFGLKACPPTLGMKLEEQAAATLAQDQVEWAPGTEGVKDVDAGPMPDPSTLTDDQLCDYVQKEIERSGKR